jgi:hypothetical protein
MRQSHGSKWPFHGVCAPKFAAEALDERVFRTRLRQRAASASRDRNLEVRGIHDHGAVGRAIEFRHEF